MATSLLWAGADLFGWLVLFPACLICGRVLCFFPVPLKLPCSGILPVSIVPRGMLRCLAGRARFTAGNGSASRAWETALKSKWNLCPAGRDIVFNNWTPFLILPFLLGMCAFLLISVVYGWDERKIKHILCKVVRLRLVLNLAFLINFSWIPWSNIPEN